MILQKLELKNFKGLRNYELILDGKSVDIFADNGCFKTTIFDAFSWLLFNKNSTNQADFEIKTLDESGQPIHGLEHEVEAVLDIDGTQLILRKVYTENWTKKRGSATPEFSGHTTNYFVNGVPVKQTEYQARIASIVDENAFRLLTNPRHFNEVLHWQDRRKLLLEVCGDVSDEDVISADSKLSKLPDILQGKSLEDHRKIIAAKRTEINKRLQELPIRISEVHRGLPEEKPTDDSKLITLRQQRTAKNNELTRIESGGEVAAQTKALAEVEAEILKLEREQWTKSAYETQAAKSELRRLEDEREDLAADIRIDERYIEENQREVETLEVKIDTLRLAWNTCNSENPTFELSGICPTCGQDIPEETILATKTKAQEKFNLEKAEQLEAINNEGNIHKAEVEGFKIGIAHFEKSKAETEAQLAKLNEQIAEASTVIESLSLKEMPIWNSPEVIKLAQKKNDIEAVVGKLMGGAADAVADVRADIAIIDQQIAEQEQIITQVKQREEGQKRIEELKAEERQLSKEFEELESQLFLCDQFVIQKVSMLEENINSKFKLARFKTYEMQVNGAVNDQICETTFQGVPYSSLNNSARINIGLDIINTLAEYYSFTAPIFADNAEAVTQLLPTKGQQIRLYVSESDKVLRVETAKEAVAA